MSHAHTNFTASGGLNTPRPITRTDAGRHDDLTDCPRCGRLCLGASVLPCGHVTCAACLRHLVTSKSNCPFCRQAIRQPGGAGGDAYPGRAELVLQDLVNEQLVSLSQRPCQVCQKRGAMVICQDCRQMYCHSCSAAHKKMKASSKHNQQLLPHLQQLQAAHAGHGARSEAADNVSMVPGIAQSETNFIPLPATAPAAFTRHSVVASPPDLRRGGAATAQSVIAAGSLASGQTKSMHSNEWVDNQIRILRDSANGVGEVALAAEEFSQAAQQLARETRRKEAFLNEYAERLLNCDVRKDVTDSQFYVTGLSTFDATAEMKWEDMERRLAEVRTACARFDHVDSLQTKFSLLMLTFNKASRAADPLIATPRRVFEITAYSPQRDLTTPFITDVLSTRDGRVMLADAYNKRVKVASLLDPRAEVSASLKLDTEPGCLALLSDGLIAVTAKEKTVYLLEFSGPAQRLSVKSQFTTSRQYVGVAQNPDTPTASETLLVSCWRNDAKRLPASIDVIRRDGSVLRTVTDGVTLSGLHSPRQMCVMDSLVLVPDCARHCVYRVSLSTGGLGDVLADPDLRKPLQVTADQAGNIYAVSSDNGYVLVRSPSGQWRRLLDGTEETLRHHAGRRRGRGGGVEGLHPFALCLTDSGLVVTWAQMHPNHTVAQCYVVGYDFV